MQIITPIEKKKIISVCKLDSEKDRFQDICDQ